MKKLFILLVLVFGIIYYFGCGDSAVNTTTTNFDGCIKATLSGWIPGNKLLYAQMNSNASGIYKVAECTVDSTGNFNLCLPSLSDTTLYSSDSIFYAGCHTGNVTFNPPDVRGTQIFNYRVRLGTQIVGAVDCVTYTRSDSIKSGDFEVMYIYVNKNVTVTGSKICNSDTLQFNGSAVAGWNKIIKHYVSVSQTGRTILYDGTEPPGAIWRYHGS